jgi:hypothetical protein
VAEVRWRIYDLNGTLISSVDDRAPGPCWNIPRGLSGVFLARLEITRADGDALTKIFKIAVLP